MGYGAGGRHDDWIICAGAGAGSWWLVWLGTPARRVRPPRHSRPSSKLVASTHEEVSGSLVAGTAVGKTGGIAAE